ncbi:C40 family peptidase [Blastococcus sp. TML/M2B]|uniref:C40 family peptidase n=1 Tax=unclassified Blastococcus TaxID=2619396 RepID=UPI00190BBE2B|nr:MULTISPECIES: NlpC/P60 family protein [unclassified Blastococcus]MBN1092355.1 C40 family peptidase [Blastococcus sp. TML/M2B]MBN1097552.1 C40 family peptidase [Blastococcus sp. TML/C7B]
MATPHALPTHVLAPFRPDPAGPARRVGRLRAGLLIGAATALAVTVLPGSATAAPSSPAEAAQLVADASHELEVVSEQLNEARVDLERQRAAVDTAELAAFDAQQQRAALDGRIRQLARSAYTAGGATRSQLGAMLTSDSAGDLVSQLGTLDALAARTNAAVSEVAEASERAEETRAEAREAREKAERSVADIEAQQKDLEARVAEHRRQYAALDAAQRAVVERAHGDSQPVRASRGTERTAPAPTATVAAPSGAAQVAVNTALAQVGDRYVYGAGGPDAFDCSGLTSFAYRAAGVSLPHSSRSQSQMGTPVSRGELQPGDLIFFYSPVSHVGMYIGNGQMVHASTESQPVKVASVDSMGSYNSARRIVG